MSSVVDHVAIVVDDLEVSTKWYISKLNGVLTYRQENYHRIKVGNTNIALLDKNFKTSKPHIGILCRNMDDLPSEGDKISHRDGTTGVYMKDPSGNYIEFIHYDEKCNKFLK